MVDKTAAPPAAASTPEPSFIDNIRAASSGDRAVLADLVATVGSFCVRVLVAALILWLTLWASKKLANLVEKAVLRAQRHHGSDTTLSDFISGLVRYLIIAIGLVAVLQQLGVQATSVLAVLGAASLAVGLALQGTLGNVAAGVMILLTRPYRVGDRVELNGRTGKVTALDLFSTKLRDYDGQIVHLPNGKVFGDMIVNTSQSGERRIDLTFGIDYEDDLDLALKLLTDLAAADKRVLAKPAPWSNVTALADSAVNVTLRCWSTPDDWNNTKFDLVKRVKETFEANGLSFPYPHQVAIEHDPPKIALKKA